MEETTTTESSAATTTETPTTTATTTDVSSSTTADTATTTAPATETVSAYTPNYKFKVKDKELEFDDFVRPAITSKEVEDKLRDLYAKAHGLDEVKTARDTFKTKAQELEEKYTTIDTSLKQLGKFVQKKDFRTFFDALSIPRQDIINYALEELKIQELPSEQREAIEAQRLRDLELEQQLNNNQTLHEQMANLVAKQTGFELNQELAKPEVSAAIAAFEAKTGKAGAFRAEVIRRGQYYEAVHKVSPPASQLVQEVLSLIGDTTQTPPGSVGSSPSMTTQGNAQVQKPIIPTFSGGSTKSPTKKVITSIEDLRKARQNLNA